jgi:hypothetical protein
VVCAKVVPAVSGLEQEFPGKVTARNVDATSPEGVEAAKSLGFKSHGLVVKSDDGKLLMKQADHTVNMDGVRKTIQASLGA